MKKTVIRFSAILMSLILLLSSLPLGVFAADLTGDASEIWVDGKMTESGSDISAMWKKAVALAPLRTDETKKEVVLKLGSDWTAENKIFGKGEGFKSGAVLVPENKLITLDLNGFSVDRKLVSATANGMVFYIEKGAIFTVKDSNPESRTQGKLQNGVWVKEKNEEGVGILGGVITGGNNLTDGGAFYMEELSTITMEGGTIAGNIAKGGAGVQIEGDSAKLRMSENSLIMFNKAFGPIYGGGGICADGINVTIAGGKVASNTATYGGGIYCYNESTSIIGVNISQNKAEKDGGGIYAEKTGASVSGCEISNNTAENGGAMYVYASGVSISDSVVKNNSADFKGDGIFVKTDCDMSVSGKLIVKENGTENIYLEGNNDLTAGSMSVGSEVYLTLSDLAGNIGADKPFVTSAADTRPHYFYSDVKGYYVARQNDPSKDNYRYLYMETGERPEIPSEVLKNSNVNTTYGVYEGDNGSYDLYKGNFEYASVLDTENNYAPTFYYSDGYFDSDPKVFNIHLATMSLSMAMSAFVKNTTEEEKYLNQFSHVKQLMADIGCADDAIYINDDYTKKPAFFGKDADRLSTIGVAVGSKKISIAGEEYTLIPVAVRGAGYEIEWASNGTMGKEGESQGFADAAQQTFELIEWYVNEYGLSEELKNGKVKFWLMGYSRASATANMAAKRLVDKYGQTNDVYAYCFEVPQGGTDSSALKEAWTDNGGYYSIHNIINKADFVPPLMPKEMGFKRYGVDHYVPGDPTVTTPVALTNEYNGGTVTTYSDNKYEGYEVSYDTSSLYFKQRAVMLNQLQAVNPDLQFEDYFHEATINYMGYVVGLKDLIGEVKGKGLNQQQFIDDVFFKLQDWGMSNEQVTKYREYFTSYKPWADIEWGDDKPADLGYFDTDMTLEDAIAVVMQLIFGKSSEDSDAIIDILLSSALGISAIDFEEVSLLELYLSYIGEWQNKTPAEKVEMGNKLIDAVLKERYPGAETVFDYLTEEEAEDVLDALPIILDLLLTVVGEDYAAGILDESQVSVGTFAYNLNTIIMAHYPEINLAWLRSYDSHFENDTKAFSIKAENPTSPTGILTDTELKLESAKGSSIYYSFDGGETYELYRKTIKLDNSAEKVLVYTMAYGLKSDVKEILITEKSPENSTTQGQTPSADKNFSVSGVMILAIAIPVILIIAIVAIVISRKRKNNFTH